MVFIRGIGMILELLLLELFLLRLVVLFITPILILTISTYELDPIRTWRFLLRFRF